MRLKMKKKNNDLQNNDLPKNKQERFDSLSLYAECKAVLCDAKETEEKIQIALRFMNKTLAASLPRLKDFWDIKHLCGPLFKKPMNSTKKNHLWSQYVELSKEARRLKKILDEQSAFFVEQIELAIKSLEGDFSHCTRLADQMPHPQLPKNIGKWIKKIEIYSSLQRELNILSTLVGRFNALKKEVIATDHLRFSVRNRLIRSLAHLSSQLFPRRTQLIEEISDAFSRDVEAFVKERFMQIETHPAPSPYSLRGEVQSFQAVAKALSLNTNAFTKTQSELGNCWERVQEMEKKRRQTKEDQAKTFEKNKQTVACKIELFEELCSLKNNLSREHILHQAAALQKEILRSALHRDDLKQLSRKIENMCAKALAKIDKEIEERQQKQSQEITTLREELMEGLYQEQNMDFHVLFAKRKKMLASFRALHLSELERQSFERDFLRLDGSLLNKKEAATHSLDGWKSLLKERGNLVKQIKKQVEEYRKEMGGSSLDFETGMTYRGLYDNAKVHLSEVVEAMDRLKEKIEKQEL